MHKWLIAALAVIVTVSVSPTFASFASRVATPDEQEPQTFSSEIEKQNYLSIVDVRITQMPTKNMDGYPTNTTPGSGPGSAADALGALGPLIADPSDIGAWIAFGQKAWNLVVANRPVSSVQSARVSVLPMDRDAWSLMSGWRGPASTSYEVAFVNSYGTTVIDHTYAVTYNYGGQVNGQGLYLANVTVAPTAVKVVWGFTLNSSVEVGQILNTGTVASPVPSVDLQLKWNVKTVLQDWQGADHCYVKGDGTLLRLAK